MQQEELYISKFNLDFVEVQLEHYEIQSQCILCFNIIPRSGALNWRTHTPSGAREKMWGYASKLARCLSGTYH